MAEKVEDNIADNVEDNVADNVPKEQEEEDDSLPDFKSSRLGEQDYWEAIYEEDLEAFEDVGDIGEIWFGEATQNRVVKWISKSQISKSAPIIDLGCGNEMLLQALRMEGFADLTGVDYSADAIILAEKISAKQEIRNIAFEVCDILSYLEVRRRENTYQVCIDKGTYDAISCKKTEDPTDRKTYLSNVCSMLKPRGLFIITSCNWTKEELVQFFGKEFDLKDEIPAPTFKFGGQTGQKVTSLIFSRKIQ